jgi:hypothetical protein
MNMIEMIRENKDWIIPIIIAVVSAIITGIFKLLKVNGKNYKQEIGDISNSHVINVNGDVNQNKGKSDNSIR